MAFLWPESDSARASNSLRQTLFRIRQDLGEDVFLPDSVGGLQLNPDRLTVDLWEFREAVKREALEEAVRLYGGPFLDGFGIAGTPEFTRWMETERDRLAQQHVGILNALASRASAEGRHEDAVSWCRRQAAADPYSSRAALALLKALVAAGDRPGALGYASVYQNLVRLHLEIDPDPAVVEFVAALGQDRAEPDPQLPRRERQQAPAPVAAPTAIAASSAVSASRAEPSKPRGLTLPRWSLGVAAAAAVVLVSLGAGRSMIPERGAGTDVYDGAARSTMLEGGILDGSTAVAGACALNVPESDSYTLVYALPIPASANYQDGFPPYSVDRSESLQPFDRVAYCLQLDDAWVWVSMDAFTRVPAQLGVPVVSTGATFQRKVADMNVFSNVPGVVTGTGITTGNIEFWHHCYDQMNSVGLPGASSTLHDFDDSYPHPRYDYDSCYGSMQVHNFGARQTVFAYNQWDRDPELSHGPDDLGIGSNPVGIHPDWTFESNAGRYSVRTLYVLARTADDADPR